jgi:FkbM family methyltransferase
MNNITRFPKFDDLFKFLVSNNIDFTDIIDVGAQPTNVHILDFYPASKFHLIEPQTRFNESIAEKYKNANYTLYNATVDATCYSGFIIDANADVNSLIPMWHFISNKMYDQGWSDELNRNVVSSTAKEITTVDTLLQDTELGNNVFLKVDVDGSDLKVLEGSTNVLSKTLMVMVECSLRNITEIVTYLAQHNFTIIDLIDITYYNKTLTQVDLIFFNKSRLSEFSIFDIVTGKSNVIDQQLYYWPGYWDPTSQS